MIGRNFLAPLAALTMLACDDSTRSLSPKVAAPTSVRSDAEYSIQDLGTLGGTWSYATALNDAGVVVGVSETESGTYRAFVWTPAYGDPTGGRMQDLGTLAGWHCSGAQSINNHGDIVGFVCKDNLTQPVVWRRTGESTYMLEVLDGLGGHKSSANGITNGGMIVGNSCTEESITHAMRWTSSGAMLNIGLAGGVTAYAQDVNENGDVVVVRDVGEASFTYSYVWNERDGFRDLGNLGGTGPADGTIADAINDQGAVVGGSVTADSRFSAFLWTPAEGLRDIGTLGGMNSTATGINNSGEVAGFSETGDHNLRAFVWSATRGMRDLGALFGGGYSDATDINQRGDVVGSSQSVNEGPHAVLWTRSLTRE